MSGSLHLPYELIVERSILHYHAEFSLPIIVEKTLFRVPGTIMYRRSALLKQKMQENDLLSDVYYDDKQAIRLDSVSAEEFTALMDYIVFGEPFDDDSTNQYPLDALTFMLKASTKLGVPDARYIAMHHLDIDKGFDVAEKCRLGLDLNIPDWFQSASKRLITTPISDYSLEQCHILGFDLLFDFIQIRAKVDRLRLSMAVTVPQLSANNCCGTLDVCHKSWAALWSDVMMGYHRRRTVVDQDTGKEGTFKAYRESGSHRVCDICLKHYLEEAGRKGYLSREELLLDRELRLLVKRCGIDCVFFPNVFNTPCGLDLDDEIYAYTM